jgi:aspartate kinase
MKGEIKLEIVVQKYGGTAVSTKETREMVYEKIVKIVKNNKKLVVVISAIGRVGAPYATDTLINLIKSENKNVNSRELDMIYSCGEIISTTLITANLQNRGYKAICLTGQQAGIFTDDNFTDANILKIKTDKIINLLSQNYIVVIAGSQGVTEDNEITSLGRGGSDTTACALAIALGSSELEIYSDVQGVMTGDPCKIENTKLLRNITYDDCKNIVINSDKKIMHPRSLAVVKGKNINLKIKSTFESSEGTVVCNENNSMNANPHIICICEMEKSDKTIITLVGKYLDKYDNLQYKIKKILDKENIVLLHLEKSSEIIKISVNIDDGRVALNALHILVC